MKRKISGKIPDFLTAAEVFTPSEITKNLYLRFCKYDGVGHCPELQFLEHRYCPWHGH